MCDYEVRQNLILESERTGNRDSLNNLIFRTLTVMKMILNSVCFLAIVEIPAHNRDEPMIDLDRITVTYRSRSVPEAIVFIRIVTISN